MMNVNCSDATTLAGDADEMFRRTRAFSRQVTIAHGTRVTVDPLPALTLPRTSLESLEAATQMLISSLNLAATVDFCHAVLTRPMAGVGLSR